MRLSDFTKQRFTNKKKVILLDVKSYYPSPPCPLGLLMAYAIKIEEIKENVAFIFLEYPREVPVSKIVEEVLDVNADLVTITEVYTAI